MLQHVVHASLHGIAYGRVKVKGLADIATYAVRFILQEPSSPPCNLLSASAAKISQQVSCICMTMLCHHVQMLAHKYRNGKNLNLNGCS